MSVATSVGRSPPSPFMGEGGRGVEGRGWVTISCVAALTFVVASPVFVSATGCASDDCGGESRTWGSCTQGERVDDYTWESGPVDGTYLDLHGGTTWTFDPSAAMGKRAPVGFQAFLSFGPEPFAPACERLCPVRREPHGVSAGGECLGGQRAQ